MNKSIYLMPGMQVKVKLFNDLEVAGNGYGFFVTSDTTRTLGGVTYNLTKGFAITDDTVGTLSEEVIDGGQTSVIYTHNKPEKNTILCFLLEKGKIATLDIITTPIHDHSSIVQGGPSYGTYFDDDESVE